MKNTPYFAIQQAGREASVQIYGDITPYPCFESDVSALSIADQIAQIDADVIHVHIDSYGGAVSEGWAIYNALRAHPAKIITHGDGFVASAALYPFLAGEERIACNPSAYFLHAVSVGAHGYADDLRKAAEEADVMTDIGIAAFVENTKLTAEEVRELMENETWLSPMEALEKGIATSITPAETAAGPGQSVKHTLLRSVLCKTPAPAPKKPEPQPAERLMQALAGHFYTGKED